MSRVDHIYLYFKNIDPDICDLCTAIKDKKTGLGIVWGCTDFEGIRSRLSVYPKNTTIGQERDYLFSIINDLMDSDNA